MNTRFFNRLFSAVEEEESELLQQVQQDLQTAREEGSLSTDELDYQAVDKGVEVLDKGTGEKTLVMNKDGKDVIKSDERDLLMDIKETVEDIQSSLDEEELDKKVKSFKAKEEPEEEVSKSTEVFKDRGEAYLVNIEGSLFKAFILDKPSQGNVLIRVPSQDFNVTIPESQLIPIENKIKGSKPKSFGLKKS